MNEIWFLDTGRWVIYTDDLDLARRLRGMKKCIWFGTYYDGRNGAGWIGEQYIFKSPKLKQMCRMASLDFKEIEKPKGCGRK